MKATIGPSKVAAPKDERDGRRHTRPGWAVRGGALLALLGAAQAAALVAGRPARTVAVAGAVAGMVMVLYLHLIRHTVGRPIR